LGDNENCVLTPIQPCPQISNCNTCAAVAFGQLNCLDCEAGFIEQTDLCISAGVPCESILTGCLFCIQQNDGEHTCMECDKEDGYSLSGNGCSDHWEKWWCI